MISSARKSFPSTRQRGLTLVEIMVAIVISLVLLAGVIQIYLGSKTTYRTQEGLSRLQENARFAIEFMARDIRMAGFSGCTRNVTSINNTLQSPPPSFSPATGIQGWEANGTAPGQTYTYSTSNVSPTSTTSGWSTSGGNVLDATMAVPGSDIVRIWRGSENPVRINSITPGAAQTVVNTTFTDSIQDNAILLLSDCESADWVQACNVQSIGGDASLNLVLSAGCTPGNNVTTPLGTQAGGEIVEVVSNIYYVGKRGDNAQNPPSLFRRPLGSNGAAGTPEELVEGVENMQILYGEDSDGDGAADQFRTANNVPDWTKVVSVKLALLMRTTEQVRTSADTSTYSLNGTTIDPADDRRLRRAFTTTIHLRNRTL